MRYQIMGQPWPVTGDRVIPVGVVVDTTSDPLDDWSRLAVGKALPPNAIPLSQDAYDLMRRQGIEDNRIAHVGEGVVRRA